MSFFFVILIIIGYLGGTMYFANQQQQQGLSFNDWESRGIRALLYGGVGIIAMLGLFLVTSALTVNQMQAEGVEDVPEISSFGMVIGLGVVVAAGVSAYLFVNSAALRFALRQRIPAHRGYNPHSAVHITAIVFCLLISVANIVLYIVGGGDAGVQESAQEIPLAETLLLNGLFVGTAFLGIGYAIRRDGPGALKRLGLRVPTDDDWRMGVVVALGLFFTFIVLGVFITLLLGDTNNQAAQNQVDALASAPIVLLFIQLTAVAIGEEIFFRGALQPIFGNILTSIMFMLLHTQLLASPLIVLLFVLSLTLGWLRDRYSTTATIIAHFFYNLLQLALSLVAGSIVLGGI